MTTGREQEVKSLTSDDELKTLASDDPLNAAIVAAIFAARRQKET